MDLVKKLTNDALPKYSSPNYDFFEMQRNLHFHMWILNGPVVVVLCARISTQSKISLIREGRAVQPINSLINEMQKPPTALDMLRGICGF